jgi:hypothetical protein
MFKRWAKNLGAVGALVVVSILSLIIFAVGANFLQAFLVTVYQGADWTTLRSVQASFTVRTFMNFYYVLGGILFLGFFFLMENRLITTGVPKKLVLRRTSFTLGIELLILALIQTGMMFFMTVITLQVVLVVVEVLLGVGLIYIARRKAAILPGVKENK